MTSIEVYDYIAERLEKSAEKLDTTVAEVVDELVADYLDELVNE